MRLVILMSLVLVLAGCGTMGGGADYTYEHVDKNGASCHIEVGSMRSLQGVNIRIDDKCGLEATADTAKSNDAMVGVLRSAVDKIPDPSLLLGAPLPIPAP